LSSIISYFYEVYMEWSIIISQILEYKEWSISQLCDFTGFDYKYVHALKTGKSKNPRTEFIKTLVQKVGLDAKWILTGEGPMFLEAGLDTSPKFATAANLSSDHPPETAPKVPLEPSGRVPATIRVVRPEEIAERHFLVPLLDQKVSAGWGADLPEGDEPLSYIPAPAYLSRYGRDVAALQVRGDSMEPTLKDGDLVVCDTHGWQGDGIYVIQMDGEGFVKRLTRRPGRLVIISDNSVYHPYEESLESQALRVVGRVRCAVRKME
jgi:phage repressor protein C with HTH and peptisase S24 domain